MASVIRPLKLDCVSPVEKKPTHTHLFPLCVCMCVCVCVCVAWPPTFSKTQTEATGEWYGDLALVDNTTELMYRLQRPAKQGLDVKALLGERGQEVERMCVA